MITFLSIHHTYDTVELALMQETRCIEQITESKLRASKRFVLMLDHLLRSGNLSMSHIAFMAVNQGPGPFTTLRTVISSVNGLYFATRTPLVGIDALDAMLQEYANPQVNNTVVLLNAYSNDVYFAMQQDGQELIKGCKNIDVLLAEIKNTITTQPIQFVGNGTRMHQNAITALFGNNAIIPDTVPETCSIEQIGRMGLHSWQETQTDHGYLQPLYLKQEFTVIHKK